MAQDSKYASRIKYLSKKFGGVGVSVISFPSTNCSWETSSSVNRSRTGKKVIIPLQNGAGHW